MFNSPESTEVTRKLLIALGLEIQPDTHILIDQDTKSQLAFNGKFIKANDDYTKALYVSDYDIKLDPIDPKSARLMEMLFGKFLDDSSSEDIQNIPEVLTYFFDKDENDMYCLNIKFENNTRWIGNWYHNKIICFLESIFSIDGTFADIDLRPYDVVQEE